jgi:hypothetical protein
VWVPDGFHFDGPAERLYGTAFGAVVNGPPRSVLIANGSAVSVHSGTRVA